MSQPKQSPNDNLLSTQLSDPRAERARRSALQAYIAGKTTYAKALERVRRAIEKYQDAA